MNIKSVIFPVAGLLCAAFAVSVALAVNSSEMETPSALSEGRGGHSLVKLWKEYEAALAADRPQKEEAVLGRIMSEAMAKDLSWDFYDAAVKYYSTAVRRDWKRAADISSEIKEMVVKYDNPVVTYRMADAGYVEGVTLPEVSSLAGRPSLRTARSGQFYTSDRYLSSNNFPGYLTGEIASDYEYLLWSQLMRSYERKDRASFPALEAAAKEYFSSEPIKSGYVDYLEASISADESVLESFARENDGKAVALFAWAELLTKEYRSMRQEAVSSDFVAFREKCSRMEASRKGFKADEGKLLSGLTAFTSLMESMDEKKIIAWAEDDSIKISLKNLEAVSIVLTPASDTSQVKVKPVLETSVTNPVKSYCVPDTVAVALPAMDDGSYLVKCTSGKQETSFNLSRHSVSLAMQFRKDGCAIYAADYISGRPVDRADIQVKWKGVTVWSAKDVDLDGFTLLGEDFRKAATMDGRYFISLSYKDENGFLRVSNPLWFNPVRDKVVEPSQNARENFTARIFKDRAAFNPGDTVRFKAVVGMVGPQCSAAVGSGTRVQVELLDSERGKVESKTLCTNEFGSVDSFFALPSGRRNGTFTIRLQIDGKTVTQSTLTVDDFVLPEISVDLDKPDKVWFPGDTVKVTGALSSYSGRPLTAAQVTWTVTGYDSFSKTGKAAIDQDGKFTVEFVAPSTERAASYYSVMVKAVDSTGETVQTSAVVYISNFSLLVNILNTAPGSIEPARGNPSYNPKALDSEAVEFSFSVKNGNYNDVGCEVSYSIVSGNKTLFEGTAPAGEKLRHDLSAIASGNCTLKATVQIGSVQKTVSQDFILTRDEDTALDAGVEHYFKVLSAEKISAQFGAADGPVWAVVQLLGCDGSLLLSDKLCLDGRRGEPGSLEKIEYEYKEEYPGKVRLSVMYFRNGRVYRFSHDCDRAEKEVALPLSFSRFTEKAYSGDRCFYELTVAPSAECLVSVYDVTTEVFRQNIWQKFYSYSSSEYFIGTRYINGYLSGRGSSGSLTSDNFPRTMVQSNVMLKSMAARSADEDVYEDDTVEAVTEEDASAGADSGAGSVKIRENFDKVLAFYPYLRPDTDGKVTFSFDAADKLSTFCVSVFAHDKSLNSNMLRRQMTVSLPVEVSLLPPAFLYAGDSWSPSFTIGNSSGRDVEGEVSLQIYAGADYKGSDPIASFSEGVSVGKSQSAGGSFSLEVPCDVDTLGVKLVYAAAGDYSDALFLTVPVLRPEQTVVESHAELKLPGADVDSLKQTLLGAFTGTTGYGAEYREKSLLGMILESVPGKIETESNDVLSLSEAYYMFKTAAALGMSPAGDEASLLERVLACRNADGGFGWFEGFMSSPVITAVVLERFAGDTAVDFSGAVKYLDRVQFSEDRPLWYGALSLEEYLYVRTMYPEVEFMSQSVDRKQLKKFSAQVRDYLLPKKKRGHEGTIISKARRSAVLMALAGEDSESLALSFGLKAKDLRKIPSSIEADILSLTEYAVRHNSSGYYFPNAVMPFRGLLSGEIYAHSMLCDLMQRYSLNGGSNESLGKKASEIAEGVRLWLMVQKETQHWDEDAACLNAVRSVLSGSDALKATSLAIMTKRYVKPLGEIARAGNGMTVSRKWYRVDDSSPLGRGHLAAEDDPGLIPVEEGDTLEVGDKLVAIYSIWSEENRSFVRMTSPYYAALRPADQLSGHMGQILRAVPWRGSPQGSMARIWSITPRAYREVKSDRTIYYFDVCPEEETTLREEFYVTQAGTFSSQVMNVECLYSPHWRANSSASFRMTAQ